MTNTLLKPEVPVAPRQGGTGYMHGLDLLRVIASVCVVLTHLVIKYSSSEGPPLSMSRFERVQIHAAGGLGMTSPLF